MALDGAEVKQKCLFEDNDSDSEPELSQPANPSPQTVRGTGGKRARVAAVASAAAVPKPKRGGKRKDEARPAQDQPAKRPKSTCLLWPDCLTDKMTGSKWCQHHHNCAQNSRTDFKSENVEDEWEEHNKSKDPKAIQDIVREKALVNRTTEPRSYYGR